MNGVANPVNSSDSESLFGETRRWDTSQGHVATDYRVHVGPNDPCI